MTLAALSTYRKALASLITSGTASGLVLGSGTSAMRIATAVVSLLGPPLVYLVRNAPRVASDVDRVASVADAIRRDVDHADDALDHARTTVDGATATVGPSQPMTPSPSD